MTRHDEQHEQRLFEIVTGDLAPDAPLAAELLASCNECRVRLAALQSVVTGLDAAAAEERSILREVTAGEVSLADLHAVGTVLRQAASGESPHSLERAARRDSVGSRIRSGGAKRSARRPWRRSLGFAAMLVLAGAWIAIKFDRKPSDVERDFPLGFNAFELLTPLGAVDRYGTFEWRGRLPPQGWFVVTVSARDDMRDLATSGPITDTSWTLPESETLAWPDQIHWSLTVYDSSGTPRVSLFDGAERTPR
ncbi:MAG: hypothetical protein AB7O52_11920 [Planctomycetota bacterium]